MSTCVPLWMNQIISIGNTSIPMHLSIARVLKSEPEGLKRLFTKGYDSCRVAGQPVIDSPLGHKIKLKHFSLTSLPYQIQAYSKQICAWWQELSAHSTCNRILKHRQCMRWVICTQPDAHIDTQIEPRCQRSYYSRILIAKLKALLWQSQQLQVHTTWVLPSV